MHQSRFISDDSKLRELQPYLDRDGFMSIQGRLRQASFPEDMKHTILSNVHQLSKLVVASGHQRVLHGGV